MMSKKAEAAGSICMIIAALAWLFVAGLHAQLNYKQKSFWSEHWMKDRATETAIFEPENYMHAAKYGWLNKGKYINRVKDPRFDD